MKPIHTLFSLVVTSLVVVACLGNDPTLIPEGSQTGPAASQFQVSLEELNEELPKDSPKWSQFFYERGGRAFWRQLHIFNNETKGLILHLDNLQLDQEAVSDAVGAAIIRYLAYYHKDQVHVIRFIGGSSPGKKLTSLDPAIGELKNLQELWLANNQLQALPEKFGELENLQELWLANNQLQALPDNIRGLKSLQDIYLSANRLICLSEKLLPWFQQISYKNTMQNPWLKPDELALVDSDSLVAKAKEAQQNSLVDFRKKFVHAADINLNPLRKQLEERLQGKQLEEEYTTQLKDYHNNALQYLLGRSIIQKEYQWQEGESIVYFHESIPFYLDRQLITEQDVQDMLQDLEGKQLYYVQQ